MATKVPKLTLYRGWPSRGTYAGSPFVTKLEFRFRHANLAYSTEPGSKAAAPKGKIPYVDISRVDDAEGGHPPLLMGDSTLIIQHLSSTGRIADLNSPLSEAEKLQDLALRALLEEKLYFYLVRERWLDNFYIQRDTALYSIPYPVRVVVGYLVHRTVTSVLHGQGTGRFTAEEVRTSKLEIWRTIDGVLRQKLRDAADTRGPVWLLGGKVPTEADATLYGFIVSVLVPDTAPESKDMVKTFSNIVEYAEKIHDQYFPDYEKWT